MRHGIGTGTLPEKLFAPVELLANEVKFLGGECESIIDMAVEDVCRLKLFDQGVAIAIAAVAGATALGQRKTDEDLP